MTTRSLQFCPIEFLEHTTTIYVLDGSKVEKLYCLLVGESILHKSNEKSFSKSLERSVMVPK